jgi:hypothetical protein
VSERRSNQRGQGKGRNKKGDGMWLDVFEKGVGFRSSLRDFRKYLNASTLSTSIAAALKSTVGQERSGRIRQPKDS